MRKKNPLPIRAGISASYLYLPKGNWNYLYDFLLDRFPHLSPAILEKRLISGELVNEEGTPYHRHSPYPAETWIWYYREVEEETPVPFELNILYQDEFLIAVDKPHFLASIPGGRYLQETALIRLRKMCQNHEISPIHRLDRDTAGVLLFCCQTPHRGAYQTLFQSRNVTKTYECIAPFKKDLHFPLIRQSHIEKSPQYFTMQERQDDSPPNSQTRIELLTHNEHLAHYRLHPHTGKKHQLRVHMNGLGIPICHDEFYPQLLPARASDDFERPLQLLARSIAFTDPITGKEHLFESQRTLELLEHIQ